MDKIKMGIIGTGLAWERLHRPAYERLNDKFEIIAVCDKNIEKAKKAGATLQISPERIYSDYVKMLQEVKFDSISTMVPIEENYETAKAVIENGINLLAEKPFAAEVDKARELIEAAKYKNVKVLVGENYRYEEENIIIKELLKTEAIGELLYFVDSNMTDFPAEMSKDTFSKTEWRQHPKFYGGIFLDSAIHHIARHRFLFGDVREVFATGVVCSEDFSPYSAINAIFTYDNNITGHYMYCNQIEELQKPLIGLRIFGTKGEIFLEERKASFVNVMYKDGESKRISYTPEQGYYNQLINFYEALSGGKEIISNPEKEIGDIKVICDILKSIENR